MSVIAGLATTLGALLVVMIGSPRESTLAMMLGGAAGIMVVVVLLDLMPSAFQYGSALVAIGGWHAGIALLYLLDKFFANMTKRDKKRDSAYLKKMGYLIAMGIALHDLPEGIAIAVGYAATDSLGLSLALAIGLHNVPEGMAVAAPLLMAGTAKWFIMLLALFLAIFTPLGTVIGLVLVALSPNSMAFLLALAGGAMSYIVLFELWPESKRRHPNYARLGILMGVVLMALVWFIH